MTDIAKALTYPLASTQVIVEYICLTLYTVCNESKSVLLCYYRNHNVTSINEPDNVSDNILVQ